jgi:hypothetical protein
MTSILDVGFEDSGGQNSQDFIGNEAEAKDLQALRTSLVCRLSSIRRPFKSA